LGKLIAVVGNTGIGKTMFLSDLCKAAEFISGFEQHDERPFQELLSLEHQSNALVNQIDYMLLTVEQKIDIRQGENGWCAGWWFGSGFFCFHPIILPLRLPDR